jgi:hypothetical protein
LGLHTARLILFRIASAAFELWEDVRAVEVCFGGCELLVGFHAQENVAVCDATVWVGLHGSLPLRECLACALFCVPLCNLAEGLLQMRFGLIVAVVDWRVRS